VLPGKDLDKVASLPTREQALSMLLGALKAPMQKLASLLAEPPAKLARALAALVEMKKGDQKGGAAAAPAANA
jgi:large subunit ribosomal protein L10